jgi:hypothetical protein
MRKIMKFAAQRGALTSLGLMAMTAFISPGFLRATSLPACPVTVIPGVVFGSESICYESDNYWLNFTDLSTVDSAYTALPANLVFHIDSVASGIIAITIEPALGSQFQAGDTYAWEFDVVENDPGNPPFSDVSSAYDADSGTPSLLTTVNAVSVAYPFDTNSPGLTVGSRLAQLTLPNGGLQEVGIPTADGLQFVNVLSDIGSTTAIQSISNDVEETPEPGASVLLVAGLIFLLPTAYRRFART